MDQYIGKLLDNRYEILEVIGTGGMARVYKARCHRLNRLVAIKILREDLAQDTEIRRRFHDESQAVAMLSHPNIMAIYDVSRSSDLEYIVMELIDGITLKQYMQKKGNKLNWREALHFITQIVKGLDHAHNRGIIHRDIKPHNVMVLRDGSVKVTDFGIARVASGGHSTLTQEALGSVHYISPEQARGSHIDARSDLYSAGVVLYEMITGRLPFEGDSPVSVAIQHINSIPLSPRELDPSLPEALETITMKAMAPNPDKRYLSAEDMLADLEEFRKNPNINFDYKSEEIIASDTLNGAEDPDRTRIRSLTPTRSSTETERRQSTRKAEIIEKDEDDYEEDRPRRGSPWPIVFAVLLIFAFISGAFYFIYQNFLLDFMEPQEQYAIPNVTGQLLDEVRNDPSLLGNFLLVEGESREDDSAAGTILKQEPEAGTQVLDANSTITVTVSSGPKIVTMISVDNSEYLKALVELQNMGLRVATPTYESSEEVEAGYIISATPHAGTPMRPDQDEVHLVVSTGPETKKVAVRNFVGQTISWAESKLSLDNLQWKIFESHSSEYPAGQVMDQNPQAGTEVDVGSTINLEVSLGPDPADIPQEVTTHVTILLPEDFDPPIIQLTVTMDDGTTCFDGLVDTSMLVGKEIPVTGSGQRTLSVYYNGVFSHTIGVDFDNV